MEREDALDFLGLAHTIAGGLSHEEAEKEWRAYVVKNAGRAFSLLTARDVMQNVGDATKLYWLMGLCPSCYVDTTRDFPHKADCELYS